MSVLDLEPGRRSDIREPLHTVRCRQYLTFLRDGHEVGYVNAEFDFSQLSPSLYEAAIEALQARSLDAPSPTPGDEPPRRPANTGSRPSPPRLWWRRLFGTP
jgi:hypothetical protein